MTPRRDHVSRLAKMRRSAHILIERKLPASQQAEARELVRISTGPILLGMIRTMKRLPDQPKEPA